MRRKAPPAASQLLQKESLLKNLLAEEIFTEDVFFFWNNCLFRLHKDASTWTGTRKATPSKSELFSRTIDFCCRRHQDFVTVPFFDPYTVSHTASSVFPCSVSEATARLAGKSRRPKVVHVLNER